MSTDSKAHMRARRKEALLFDMGEALTARGLDVVDHLANDAFLLRESNTYRLVVLRVLPWNIHWTRDFVDVRGPALCSLRHPGIVRILAVETQDNCHYLLREYVEGIDAQTEGTQLPVALACHLAVRIIDALVGARPLVGPHFRLCPEHVLVSVDGDVKLIGFEDASTRVLKGVSGPIRRHNWLRYLSPEQVLDDSPAPYSDCFSLGACIWTWLVGHPPFPRQGRPAGTYAALHSIVRDRPPPIAELRPDVPKQLSEVVLRALARDPGDRFANLEQFASALNQVHDYDHDLGRHALAAWVFSRKNSTA